MSPPKNRSWLVGAGLVLAVVGSPLGAAEAQVMTTLRGHQQSPQHFALELRFGPYRPDVDSEFSGSRTPYRDFFGSDRHLMTQIEFDYQLIRHVGSFGIGASVGYFKQTGNNLYADGTARQSADVSSIRLLPLALSAVYRFDLAYERLGIPLVPYGKLGFDYVFWTVNNGNEEVPSSSGGRGQGGTLGWHAAVGLSLVLDFLDPTSAYQFDSEMGVNHTHLFFEYAHIDVSGLGQANRLHVGDTTWTAGLMFEF